MGVYKMAGLNIEDRMAHLESIQREDNQLLAYVKGKMDEVIARLDIHTVKFEALDTRMKFLELGQAAIQKEVTTLQKEVVTLGTKVASLEAKIDEVLVILKK